MPEGPAPGTVPSCAEGGVLGVLPGVLGCIQATEVLKVLLKRPSSDCLAGRVLVYDALRMTPARPSVWQHHGRQPKGAAEGAPPRKNLSKRNRSRRTRTHVLNGHGVRGQITGGLGCRARLGRPLCRKKLKSASCLSPTRSVRIANIKAAADGLPRDVDLLVHCKPQGFQVARRAAHRARRSASTGSTTWRGASWPGRGRSTRGSATTSSSLLSRERAGGDTGPATTCSARTSAASS